MNNLVPKTAVERTDERLLRFEWPGLQKIEVPSIGVNDCLLVCSGFEERAAVVVRRICELKGARFPLGLIRYLPEQREDRIGELLAIGRRAGLNITEFVYDRERPSGMGEKLRKFSQPFHRVFVDISGMSRLLIVQTLVALIASRKQWISVLYGEAKEYPPSEEEFDKDNRNGGKRPTAGYLSSGIFEIAAAPELSSVAMVGEAIRLVAFPSFNPSQLTNLVQELQPTYTNFIHGVPPRQDNAWRTEAICKLNSRTLNELQGRRDQNASTLEYRETLTILLKIYGERSMFDRLVVAPTGSKMQAVAVALFRAALHDVQIVYPTPQVFTEPENYTLGLRQLYQLDVPTLSILKAVDDVEDDDI